MYLVGIYDDEGVYRRALVDPGSGDVTNADFKPRRGSSRNWPTSTST